MRASVSARFWAKVDVRHPSECWEWEACRNAGGYGTFAFKGGQLAHRYAWREWWGVDPTLDVLHACDNRRCVNPFHLFEGDDAINSADCKTKGRTGPRVRKLTFEQADECRRLSAAGLSQRKVAARFGVPRELVRQLLRGDTYMRH